LLTRKVTYTRLRVTIRVRKVLICRSPAPTAGANLSGLPREATYAWFAPHSRWRWRVPRGPWPRRPPARRRRHRRRPASCCSTATTPPRSARRFSRPVSGPSPPRPRGSPPRTSGRWWRTPAWGPSALARQVRRAAVRPPAERGATAGVLLGPDERPAGTGHEPGPSPGQQQRVGLPRERHLSPLCLSWLVTADNKYTLYNIKLSLKTHDWSKISAAEVYTC
jgi:hypothetical protein